MLKTSFDSTKQALATELDHLDELSSYRSRFVIQEPRLIYLNGNSLGRLPKETVTRLKTSLRDDWGTGLIRSWNKGWYDLPRKVGAKISGLIGANPDEVVVSDSTTVNLYKLALGALGTQKGRTRIVTDDLNFPSNLYVLESVAAQLGGEVTIASIHSRDGISIALDDVANAVDETTALVYLSHVSYKSGFLYDLAAVTRIGQEAGALVLWDLSHSVGVVPIHLNDSGVDLAVGCTYKYLNSGPGAPAFLYVRSALQNRVKSPIWGWFGADQPFSFSPRFTASEDIRRFLVGTPPILSMKAIEPGVDLVLEAQVEQIREKSIHLTEYILFLTEKWLHSLDFELASPSESSRRGSHVTLRHPESYRISRALMDDRRGGPAVITDFREPDNLRLGVAPLYNSFADIHTAMNKIRAVAEDSWYEEQSRVREEVT